MPVWIAYWRLDITVNAWKNSLSLLVDVKMSLPDGVFLFHQFLRVCVYLKECVINLYLRVYETTKPSLVTKPNLKKKKNKAREPRRDENSENNEN